MLRRLCRADVCGAAFADVFPGPAAHPAARRRPAGQAEEVELDTADGEKVVVWHIGRRRASGRSCSISRATPARWPIGSTASGRLTARWHGTAGAELPRLWRLDRPPDRGRVDRRRRGGLRLCRQPLSAGTDRAVGRVARQRRRRCARLAPRSAASDAGVAVHLGGRRRRAGLLVPAGAEPDEGSVPLGPAHRQGHRAAAGPAWRVRQRGADRSRRAAVCARQRAEAFVRFRGGGHSRPRPSMARWPRCGRFSQAAGRSERSVRRGALASHPRRG